MTDPLFNCEGLRIWYIVCLFKKCFFDIHWCDNHYPHLKLRFYFKWKPQPTILIQASLPAGIFLFKVNNGNTRVMCGICLKLTIKTLERHHWIHFGVLCLTLNRFQPFLWCFYCLFWTKTPIWMSQKHKDRAILIYIVS